MLKQYLSNQTKRFQRVTAALVVLMVAGIGTYLIIFSHAATPYASINADKGTIANGATAQPCTGASDGSCVMFGGTQSNTTAKMIGLNGTYSNPVYLTDAQNLGAQWMRVEQWGDNDSFDPACQNATQVSQASCGVPFTATNLAAHNIHLFPQVNNSSIDFVQPGTCSTSSTYQTCLTACSMPSYSGTCTDQLAWVQSAVHAATTYAKGGTFWQGRADYGSPVIEMGNEVYLGGPLIGNPNGTCSGNGGEPDGECQNPGAYAKMLRLAAVAVSSATNGQIKLLASEIPFYTAPDGTEHRWLQDMQAAVPNIESYLGGVVSHPYGDIPPDGSFLGLCVSSSASPCPSDPPLNKPQTSEYLNWTYQQLAEVHSEWSIPVYVTEVGQKAASATWGNGQVGYTNQCLALNYYYDQLKANSWEAGVFWFNQKDYQSFDPSADNGWALVDSNNNRHQAWSAYQAQALNHSQYSC